jgi:quercetin dioxygenase-like cupin family protein
MADGDANRLAHTNEEIMQDYWIDFESLPWESVMDGVRQKVIAHSGKKVRLVEYSKAMPPHWCTKGHYGYILKGRFEIEFANRIHIFAKGVGVFIPDGEEHRHRARTLSDVVRAIFVEDA